MTQSLPNPSSLLFRFALKVQNFLLRRNWMGSAGNVLMVITTTGRKSGKRFSTPIGYQWDGDTVVAFTIGGRSNWYKNIHKNPQVMLEIKGKPYQMRAEPVTDDECVLKILELYKDRQPNIIKRFFGISPDSTGSELLKAREKVAFVRFHIG